MKNNIVIIVLIIFNVFLTFYVFNLKRTKTLIKESKVDRNFSIESRLKGILYDSWNFSCSSNKFKSNIKFKNSSSKLIFRISEYDCNECVDSIMIKFVSKYVEIPSFNILVSTGSDAYIDLLASRYKISRDNFLEYNEKINNSFEHRKVPYMFVLTSDGDIEMPFIPSKEYPDVTRNYFRIVEKRFFKK